LQNSFYWWVECLVFLVQQSQYLLQEVS